MVWDHRVMRRIHQLPGGETEIEFGIYEVFYDEDDSNKDSWTIDPVPVVGESLESLRQTLQWMLAALDKEVLNYDEASEQSADTP